MTKARFEFDGALGVLSLADPPLNLVGLELVDDLEAALGRAETAPIRALLLRADGDAFSAGAHVGEMFRDIDAAEAARRLERFDDLARRFSLLPFPTVAAVQGLCLAGGLEIVLGCDIIWAAEDAQLGLAEALIGAVPFGGGTQRVAERAGAGRAYEMAYTGRVYDAVTLERWGLVNHTLPLAKLEEKTRAFAHRLASGPTRAHAVTKKLMRIHLDEGARAANARLSELCPPLFESRDMQHGVASLLENGPGQAKFTGE